MDAVVLGMSIGLAAGISPGPLLVLVIATTLRSGWRAGALVACAPLVTDVLVVTAALLFLGNLPRVLLALLGVVGGLFVVWTGVGTIRDARRASLATRVAAGGVDSAVVALRRAALVNLLSPHPWIFWSTALGPLIITTGRHRPAEAVALGVGFYLTLVGAKIAVAVLVAGGRRRLNDAGYRRSLVAAGASLVVAGTVLAVEFLLDLR